jgi:mannose-6-phosphate isomerase-like protein (cupin superfamily)
MLILGCDFGIIILLFLEVLMAIRACQIGHFDVDDLYRKMVDTVGQSFIDEFLSAEWSMAYGDDDLMDAEVILLPEKILCEEDDARYTLVKFRDVNWHKDDHDEFYYTLHVLEGEAELWVGKREIQVIHLKPGCVYLFNSNVYHKTRLTGEQVLALINGVKPAIAKRMMQNDLPVAA